MPYPLATASSVVPGVCRREVCRTASTPVTAFFDNYLLEIRLPPRYNPYSTVVLGGKEDGIPAGHAWSMAVLKLSLRLFPETWPQCFLGFLGAMPQKPGGQQRTISLMSVPHRAKKIDTKVPPAHTVSANTHPEGCLSWPSENNSLRAQCTQPMKTSGRTGACLPTPFSSSNTAGMDTVRNTAIAGGIKAGSVCLTARLKLSGMFERGRDSPKSSRCSICGRSKGRAECRRNVHPTSRFVVGLKSISAMGRHCTVIVGVFANCGSLSSSPFQNFLRFFLAQVCTVADKSEAIDTCAGYIKYLVLQTID